MADAASVPMPTPDGDLPAADEPTPVSKPIHRSGAGAFFVAVGIMATKVFGIIRNSFLARYLGAGMVADAFNAAIRIPGLLQNLFGDGAMSAAFIPVYARLLAEGDEEEAGRLAGAVFAILALLVAILVTLGVLFTPQLLPILAGGFKGEKRELAISFVRILFPAS